MYCSSFVTLTGYSVFYTYISDLHLCVSLTVVSYIFLSIVLKNGFHSKLWWAKICGSDDLKDGFKFLFIQEKAQTEGFIMKVSEWCHGLRQKTVKFANMVEEGRSFSRFDVAAMDGMECLVEAQATNGVVLRVMIGLLDALRDARAEKRRHVMVMEVHG